MRKVVTISLNGNAYQIEEGGYETLRAYLDGAQAKLREDPDRTEILADLEQAIAEKCNRCLSAHKSVVSTEELQQIIAEMGPVDGQAQEQDAKAGGTGAEGTAAGAGASGAGTTGAAGATTGAAATKRLYQIREGAMISGVCNGIAAYFGIDVTIVRVVFVALAIITGGAWILAYIVMMFVIPYASTSEEHAAAHGLAFNAQLLIERAKKQYTTFKNDARWRRHWERQQRQWRREWRREWRRGRQTLREDFHGGYRPDQGDTGYAARVLAGVMMPVVAIGRAVLIVALVVAIAQLVTKGAIFGWAPPTGTPLWVGIIVLVVLFQICAAPLHAAHHAVRYAHGPAAGMWFALWGSIMWLGFVVLFFWLAYHYWPELQHFLQSVVDSLRNRQVHAAGDSISFW
jgi:phage shock protein PspC (stress-responsive transcriptional regulator)